MSRPTKAIAYCRIATAEQTNPNGELYDQEQRIKEYASKENIKILKWFKEVGSAVDDKPELKKAVEYCAENLGDIDLLIAAEPKRISRSISDFGEWEDAFNCLGVQLDFPDFDESVKQVDQMRDAAQ